MCNLKTSLNFTTSRDLSTTFSWTLRFGLYLMGARKTRNEVICCTEVIAFKNIVKVLNALQMSYFACFMTRTSFILGMHQFLEVIRVFKIKRKNACRCLEITRQLFLHQNFYFGWSDEMVHALWTPNLAPPTPLSAWRNSSSHLTRISPSHSPLLLTHSLYFHTHIWHPPPLPPPIHPWTWIDARNYWTIIRNDCWSTESWKLKSRKVGELFTPYSRSCLLLYIFIVVRMGIRQFEKQFDKSEDDMKALQSVGQIIGEVLKQLDDERCMNPFSATC